MPWWPLVAGTMRRSVAHDLQQQWAAEGMALALHLQLAQVAAARGSGADFERQMSIIDGFARPDDPYTVHDVTAARAEHLLWQGGADEAHRITREALDQLGDQQDAGLVVSMCSMALRAHADLVTSRADRLLSESASRETADLLAAAREAAQRDTGALGRAYLLLCEAEAARASMGPSADPWTQVVAEWQLLDCPYPAAYAQWRLAEELFGARARAQGTRALAAALQTAIAARVRAPGEPRCARWRDMPGCPRMSWRRRRPETAMATAQAARPDRRNRSRCP